MTKCKTNHKTTTRYLRAALLFLLPLFTVSAFCQQVYFIDGYHGGVYGHYPRQYTRFINQTLEKFPDWKINLEIEPETWDTVRANEPENYAAFKKYFADQSVNGRLEYVNPSYGQSYLYNIKGESIIRQFHYGIKKMKMHFPEAVFSTYSSEEPCFTSALPQILRSFGFRYASLKNPNTCWGGYTRAFGGELVNWTGPDGTILPTVPRYGIEALKTGSTWETIASTNTKMYLDSAFASGIAHPVGMCLQDAGWRNGPWLGVKPTAYPTTYTTWRNYFTNIADKKSSVNWKLSQEDILVNLVWGAQVLQQIAREVRVSENRMIVAEKMAAIAHAANRTPWPGPEFDEAWRRVLLAQHHDCWIVPYNGRPGDTWIDKVKSWTSTADQVSDSVIAAAVYSFGQVKEVTSANAIRVFNSTGATRTDWVTVDLPSTTGKEIAVIDEQKKIVPSQRVIVDQKEQLVFKASVPALGFATFRLDSTSASRSARTSISQKNDLYVIETDMYHMVIDPAKGGTVKSIIAKKLNNRELVDTRHKRSFNELRGYFFDDSNFHSSTDVKATLRVLSDGPFITRFEVKGTIRGNSFTQTYTLFQGEPLIDVQLKIDWQGSPGIGDPYKQRSGYRNEDYRKAFYNDTCKLLTLFPLDLEGQQIYKDAPFDVTKSRLKNTFFQTWDSIKNNVLLNWVDITDAPGSFGVSIFTDQTTAYVHGQEYPLGLVTQYSGVGLWGRRYGIAGPTSIHYAILPHKGSWEEAELWSRNEAWNNPMPVSFITELKQHEPAGYSLGGFTGKGFEVTAVLVDGEDLVVRLFNPSVLAKSQAFYVTGKATGASEEQLNGETTKMLKLRVQGSRSYVTLQLPAFGIRTIRFKNFISSKK